jgi:hypothetical protein
LYRTQYPTRSDEEFQCVSVSSGVSLLRYTGSAAGEASPSVHVRPVEHHASDISLIPAPGLQDSVLRAPGDYLIVRADRAGELDLRVRARRPGGSIDAQLELDRVALPLSRPSARSGFGLDILAHIARRGDAIFGAGDWICGPERPARIEGLEIRWPARPNGVSLFYSVTTGGQARRVSREYAIDEYAGTRGLSRPLIGVRFRLVGSRAEGLELRVEALFERCGVKSATGQDISLAGSTGNEALLGLRLAAEPVSRLPNAPRENLASKIVRPRNRVQVFRNPDLVSGSTGQTA